TRGGACADRRVDCWTFGIGIGRLAARRIVETIKRFCLHLLSSLVVWNRGEVLFEDYALDTDRREKRPCDLPSFPPVGTPRVRVTFPYEHCSQRRLLIDAALLLACQIPLSERGVYCP